jgi:hypothetical protein
MPQGTMSRVRVNHIGHSNTVRYQRYDGSSVIGQLDERGKLGPTPVRFSFEEDGRDDDDEIRDFDEIDWGISMDDEIPPLIESSQPGGDAPWPGETILPDGIPQPTGGEAEAPPRHLTRAVVDAVLTGGDQLALAAVNAVLNDGGYLALAVANAFWSDRRPDAIATVNAVGDDEYHDVAAAISAFWSDRRHVFNFCEFTRLIPEMDPLFQNSNFAEAWRGIFDCHFPWLSGLLGHMALRKHTERNYFCERKGTIAMKRWMNRYLPNLIPPVRTDTLPPEEAANLLFQMIRGLAIEKNLHNFSGQIVLLTANFFRKLQIWAEVLEEFTDKKVVKELAKSNFSDVREMVVRAMVEDRQP